MWTDIRAQLQTRLDAALVRHDRLSHHLRQEDGRLETDAADRAAFTQTDEVVEDIDEATIAEIASLRGALRRLDAGTWGTCTSCGEPISERRLAAMPETTRCVRCATVA